MKLKRTGSTTSKVAPMKYRNAKDEAFSNGKTNEVIMKETEAAKHLGKSGGY
jgi:hypothetical protein